MKALSRRHASRKENRLKHMLGVGQREIVVPGKVHRRMDQRVMPIEMCIAVEKGMTKVEHKVAILFGLTVQRLAVLYKPNGIGMTVLLFRHGYEPAGDPDIGISQLMQTPVDGGLTHEFIQPAIGIVIADQKDLPDILR